MLSEFLCLQPRFISQEVPLWGANIYIYIYLQCFAGRKRAQFEMIVHVKLYICPHLKHHALYLFYLMYTFYVTILKKASHLEITAKRDSDTCIK